MKNKLLFSIIFLLSGFGLWLLPTKTMAQVVDPIPTAQVLGDATDSAEATMAAEATSEAKLASPSAEVEQIIQEKKDQDITETGGKQKSKLAAYLDEHPPEPLTWHNILQHAIRKAIGKGLPANIIVLIILFPLIATVVSTSRHIIGLKGFGIYIPAVLSVAFVSTGIPTGMLIFTIVLFSAMLTRKLVRKLKLPYLPRTAMMLTGVSFLILMVLIFISMINFYSVLTISIFPLLIIILLTENFMESQLFSSQKEALRVTMETLFVALGCSLLISSDVIQQYVLLRPELTFIGATIVNYMIGRYTGLRLLEYIRFGTIINRSK